MIKKHFFPALAIAATGLLAACSGESEYHMTQIFYPEGNVGETFADQHVDSIKFITFDDWRLTSLTSWATLAGTTSGQLPPNSYVVISVPVRFEPNTTDTSRVAMFQLASYGQTLTAYYVQRNYHKVTRPIAFDYSLRRPFAVSYKEDATEDSITFTAYEPWTVTTSAEWIQLKEENPNGGIGEHTVKFNVAKLPAGVESRTDSIIITTPSMGLSTPVKLTQKKQ